MNEQKKQNLLTAIITILVIVLVMMIGSIVYEEKINMSKQITQNTHLPEVGEDEELEDELEKENNIVDEERQDNENEEDEIPAEEKKDEFVGEEENPIEEVPENPEMTDEEKAIDLVKKQWGEDDSVTFSIAKKKGNKYYVAVKSSNTSNIWYEVNIETWEVSEY